MAAKFPVLFLLCCVALLPRGAVGWNFGELVHGDSWPTRVYDEAVKLGDSAEYLEQFVQTVHQYLVSMIQAAQGADGTTDIWKKRYLLRVVQTRMEEVRIGRRETKHLVAELRRKIKVVKSHAKTLKKKLPLWHDGVVRKLKSAKQVVKETEKWLESQKRIIQSEKALLQERLSGIDLDKLPPLNGLSQPLAASTPAQLASLNTTEMSSE